MSTPEPTAYPVRLDDSEVVYRLIRTWKDVEDDDSIKPTAFFRKKDELGMSVQIARLCTHDDREGIKPAPIEKIKALATLIVGEIRTIQGIADGIPTHLDVIPKPNDGKAGKSEAEVMNMPVGPIPSLYELPEVDELAVHIAQRLAAMCNQRKPEWIRTRPSS